MVPRPVAVFAGRALLIAALGAVVPLPLSGERGLAAPPHQVSVAPADEEARTGFTGSSPSQADSAALLREARAAQARYERRRVQFFPITPSAGGGTDCDERVGRMCLRFGRGSDWEPPPEREEVRELREELLATLERVAGQIPGDDWVLGQRVHYLGEADRWSEAEGLARECQGASPWWCRALLGHALHFQERFQESAREFHAAMQGMPEEKAREWRDLERLLDSDGARLWRDMDEDRRAALADRIWALADPLFLVPGNDRLTEHYSRHVESEIRSDARNPYNLRWGWDLAEITVRYGAEYGWERELPRWNPADRPQVLGRFHPRSRGLLPPGAYLPDPASLPPGEWTTDARRSRSRHAPSYAPRIHELDPQVAIFRRGDSVRVVASWEVESFQDFEGGPWHAPPQGEYRSALFMMPMGDAGADDFTPGAAAIPDPDQAPHVRRDTGPRGSLDLTVPEGAWLFSLETWHPGEGRAWRSRMGIREEPLPRAVVALSDLLLTEPLDEDRARDPDRPADTPESLDDLVPQALATGSVPFGGRVGVAWEVYGLTGFEGALRFRLTLGREDRGFFRRAGEWLRLVEPEPPVVVAWTEGPPDRPGPVLRRMDLDLAALDPGEYELRLELDLQGRTPVLARRMIRIRQADY